MPYRKMKAQEITPGGWLETRRNARRTPKIRPVLPRLVELSGVAAPNRWVGDEVALRVVDAQGPLVGRAHTGPIDEIADLREAEGQGEDENQPVRDCVELHAAVATE